MPGTDSLEDLYGLLGVSERATDEEIKKAYRRKARQFHPDANGGDPEAEARFKQVSIAYEVLRDPEKRARYDRFGAQGVFGQGAGGGGFNFDFQGGLGDIFEAFFGSMAGSDPFRRRGPGPGSDAEVTLRIEFAESVFGVRKDLPVRLPVTCDTCGGSGARPGTQPVTCTDCQGAGEIRRIRQSLLGQIVTSAACSRCQGTGQTTPTPCSDCRGEGRRMEDRTFAVEVPPGVEDGSTLRLGDRGPAGLRGGPNGSLFVHLSVQADERFERVGDDIHTVLHLGMTQAALGAQIDVQTLELQKKVSVAPGTQNGHVVRMKGSGVPHLRGRGRGDLFVHFVVDTPTELSQRQAELLAELAAERNEEIGSSDEPEGVLSRIRSVFS